MPEPDPFRVHFRRNQSIFLLYPPLLFSMCPLFYASPLHSYFSSVLTGPPDRMSHRKWRENKQQPSRARAGYQISCCLLSLHFLCDILSGGPVSALSPLFCYPVSAVFYILYRVGKHNVVQEMKYWDKKATLVSGHIQPVIPFPVHLPLSYLSFLPVFS